MRKKRDTPGDYETRDGIVVLRCKVLPTRTGSKPNQGWTVKTEPCVFCGLQHIHGTATPDEIELGHRVNHCVIPKAWRGRGRGGVYSDDHSWQTVKLPSGQVVTTDNGYYLKQADF